MISADTYKELRQGRLSQVSSNASFQRLSPDASMVQPEVAVTERLI